MTDANLTPHMVDAVLGQTIHPTSQAAILGGVEGLHAMSQGVIAIATTHLWNRVLLFRKV
jgi:molybdate-binding protein